MKILVDTSIWSLALRKKTLTSKESLMTPLQKGQEFPKF